MPIPDPREARARRQTVGAVTLPLSPPIKPQLALTRRELPRGEEWAYEQKLDGFRAIVFVDGEDSYIQSRGARNLSRYFPELSFAPGRYVLDGELVIRDADGNIEFDAMQSRIHPAESRIEPAVERDPRELHRLRPAGGGRGVAAGRAPVRTTGAAGSPGGAIDGIELSELSLDPAQAEGWLRSSEGTMAKQLDAPYVPGRRRGMAKVKRERTIDCVVMGWRPGKEEGTVGSLILGLYDGGELRPVGHISGFSMEAKRGMRALLAPLGDRRKRHGRAKSLGREIATSSGWSCGPSSWSRSATTTQQRDGSAMAAASTGSGTTKILANAHSTSWTRRWRKDGDPSRRTSRRPNQADDFEYPPVERGRRPSFSSAVKAFP